MKAMILAAGKGTRVRPITDFVPKPMIPIVNKPVMEFLVELLRQHGFDEIIVSTLPRRLSRWLRLDLPHKIADLGLPVTTVTPRGRENPTGSHTKE